MEISICPLQQQQSPELCTYLARVNLLAGKAIEMQGETAETFPGQI